LQLGTGSDKYYVESDGENLIVCVKGGCVTLKDAAALQETISEQIIGKAGALFEFNSQKTAVTLFDSFQGLFEATD